MLTLVSAALLASILVFIPGLMEQFEAPKAALVRTLGVAALAALGASAIRTRWRRPSPSPLDSRDGARAPFGVNGLVPLDWTLLAWVVVEALATLTSVSPRLSFLGEAEQHEGLLTSIAIAGIYAATRHALGSTEGAAFRLVKIALLGVALASVYALLQAIGLDPAPWKGTALTGREAGTVFVRPFGSLGHPNLLGVMTSAALASAIVLVAASRLPGVAMAAPGPLLGIAVITITALTTLVTLSRAAWIATAVAGTLAVFLAIRLNTRVSRRSVVWSLLIAVVVVAVVAAFGGDLVRQRFVELLAPATGTSRTRWEIWKSALAMARDRPWLGHGPGTFGLVYPLYQTPDVWRFEWGTTYFHAHSVTLHTLATRGVLGVLAGAGWIVAALGAARNGWRGDPTSRVLAATSGTALLALSIAGTFGAIGIAGVTWVAVLSGILASLPACASAPAPEPVAASKHRRRERAGATVNRDRAATRRPSVVMVAGTIAALAVGALMIADLAASRAAFDAYEWLPSRPGESGDRSAAAARRAASLGGMNDGYVHLAGQALLAAAARGPVPSRFVAEAEVLARRAIDLEPRRGLNHQGLGSILLERARLGDLAALEPGEEAFERAQDLGPRNVLPSLQLATLELALGRPRPASVLARRAVQLYPWHPLPVRLMASASAAMGDSAEAARSIESMFRMLGRDRTVPIERVPFLIDSLASSATPSAGPAMP